MAAEARGRAADLGSRSFSGGTRLGTLPNSEHDHISRNVHRRSPQIPAGAPDDYGLPPERRVSDGDGVPCRHCLQDVGKGEDYSFSPIGHFRPCNPMRKRGRFSFMLKLARELMMRMRHRRCWPGARPISSKAIRLDDRIVYGTGKIVPSADLDIEAARS